VTNAYNVKRKYKTIKQCATPREAADTRWRMMLRYG